MNKNVLLLLVSRVTRSLAAGALAVVVGLYFVHGLHLSVFQAGVIFAVGAFVTPLITFFLGPLSDKYGRKKLLMVALAFLPVSILILLLTPNFYLLLVSSALGGFGIAGGLVGGGVGATVAPMQTAILTENVPPKERTKVFSVFTVASNYSGSAGALLAFIPDYKEVFAITLLLSLASALVVIPVKESYKPKRREVSPTSRADNDIIKKFTLTGVLNGVSQGLIVPFIPIIFSEAYKLPQGTIGAVVSIGGVISATSMFLTPRLTEALGFVKLIIITRGISAVLVLLFPFLSSPLLAVPDYIAFTTFRIIALPAQQALMMNLVGEGRRATATSSNQVGRLIPAAASTSLSGYLIKAVSLVVPFEVSFAATMVNSLLYYKFFRKMDRATSEVIVAGEG